MDAAEHSPVPGDGVRRAFFQGLTAASAGSPGGL